MRRYQSPPMRSALVGEDHLPSPVLADPVVKSKSIGRGLPFLIQEAEAAGLSIIAQHLAKALVLANRVAASKDDDQPR